MRISRRMKWVLWLGVTGLAVVAVSAAWWVHTFRRYTPREVVLDVRAALAVRHGPKPVEQFLEARYGPLTEPANRQKAFLDFFNVGHIQGLHFIVSHAPAAQRQPSINAMAQWLGEYRRTMTPEEKEALRVRLGTDGGRAMLQQATAKYLSQDVYYRAATAPVITELLTTLAAVQKP